MQQKKGSNVPAAADPLTVGQGGEVSPKGDVVAAACPVGKGIFPHPGAPTISGGLQPSPLEAQLSEGCIGVPPH